MFLNNFSFLTPICGPSFFFLKRCFMVVCVDALVARVVVGLQLWDV